MTSAQQIAVGVLLLAASLIAPGACRHMEISLDDAGADSDSDSDSDSDGDSDTGPEPDEYPADGADLLIVVDNSGSMKEEQTILANHVYALIEELAGDLDSVRVGVVSSDMGLQWGGNPYEPGDGWPGDTPQGCGSVGDDGELQTYSSGKTIDLEGDEYVCPGMASLWVETPVDDEPNEDLPGQVACLTSLGTNGCGWEQQLQAAAKAVNKDSQAAFHVDEHLLVVIAISDEDDCSIESNELFAVDEVQNLADGKINIACGNHPQYLYAAEGYAGKFAHPKDDNPNGVLFAAIAGVPPEGDCQGRGNAITGCLDHPDMELDVVQEGDAYFFQPACERWEGSTQVTKARPARRFVELALAMGERSYVASICNEDWTAAMDGIAQLIAHELED